MGKVSMDLAMFAVGSVIVQQRTVREHGKGQHGPGNGGGWQCNSTTAHCDKTWERPGMDMAMVAVDSVIVQQRTVRKHGKGQQGHGNGGG